MGPPLMGPKWVNVMGILAQPREVLSVDHYRLGLKIRINQINFDLILSKSIMAEAV